ncbi:MAG: hypothetical protein ABFS38_19355 [Bacteroidota bacterium]
MRKRNLLIAALFVFVLGILPSCDILEECGTCEMVTLEADGTLTYSTPTLLCGDDLTEKKEAGTVVVDGKSIYWICE